MKTIVINASGSAGNFEPFLLIANALQAKGHKVRFATNSPYHKSRLEENGIEYAFMRQFDISDEIERNNPKLFQRLLGPENGFRSVLTNRVLPNLRGSYEDLSLVCRDADLIISGTFGYAASLLHEKKGIPWASVEMHVPMLFSDYESLTSQTTWTRFKPFSSPVATRFYKRLLRFQSNTWSREWFQLRKDLELPGRPNILLDRHLSPQLQLAAFSSHYSGRKPDWPAHRYHTGFIQPQPADSELSPALNEFLNQGEPPVVFTLGGSASLLYGEKFFQVCLELLRENRVRAVIVCGEVPNQTLEEVKWNAKDLPHVFVAAVEPYWTLFPKAKMVVHHGGLGTVAEVLKSGIPMILLPFGADQFSNAFRIKSMGCGEWLHGKTLTAKKLEKMMVQVSDPKYKSVCQALAPPIRAENGVDEAIFHLEKLL